MPTCQNCHNQWNWKQTMKKITTLNPTMICPYCAAMQYQTQKSKTKTAILTPVVLLPLLLNIFFDISLAVLLSSYLILAVLVILLSPFLVELTSKEKFVGEQ